MKKRLLHRSYILENSSGAPDGWKTSINGHPVSGQLSLLKKSVDWWCDMKAFLPPNSFEGINSRQKKSAAQQSEVYRGFRLINDSGKPNEWYVILRGQLLKGPADKIKKHLDMVITKLNAQK